MDTRKFGWKENVKNIIELNRDEGHDPRDY